MGSFLITLGAIVNHALAIRQLSTSGYDLPAKQVLRSMIEYVELLILFDKDHQTLEEYPKTDDLEYANKFWHTHLSKGKVRRTLSFKDFDEWWTEERKVLGAAAHPSRAACFAAYTSQLMDNDTGPAFLGSVSIYSIRTLRVTMVTLMELLIHCRSLRIWENDIPLKFFEFDEKNELQKTVKESWPPIVALLSFVAKNSNGNRFSVPRSRPLKSPRPLPV